MRPRFKRTCTGSSRGAYVRHSHFLYIQEELAKRGVKAEVRDIIEVSVSIRRRCAIKIFGKTIILKKEEAEKIDPELIIYV